MSGMTSERSIERRVSRLENDRDAMYELLEEFRSEARGALDELRAETNARFDGVDARFDGVDARFDRIEGTLAEVLRRLPEAG